MNRVYILSILFLLVACGKKQAISYKEYQRAHENTRERHIGKIKSDANLLDTLFGQEIALLSEKKAFTASIRDEFYRDSWEHKEKTFEASCRSHELYTQQIIYNDKTREAVQKMWWASSQLSLLESSKCFDIKMNIRYEDTRKDAIGLIAKLKKEVAEAFALMRQGAEEYYTVVFGNKKEE
jgi:hypothetical protein